MATYGKISSAFWSSDTIRRLSDDGRLMAAYLLTSSHTTICGAFRLPDGYAIEDLGWPIDRITATLSELSQSGFATRCESTKWVVIHKFLEWNPPQNENQWKAVFKKAAEVPKKASWANGFETVLKRFKRGSETVSTESESETDTETDTRTGANAPDGFLKFWSAWPKSSRKGGKSECLKVWRGKKLEAQVEEILTHVELMRRSKQWADDQYIPAPVVYLRGAKWDGAEIEAPREEYI